MSNYLLGAIVLLVLILFLPVKIHINYQRINNKDKVNIKVKILFITLHKKLSTPLVKILSLLSKKKDTQENVKEAVYQQKKPKRNWLLILRRMNIWLPRIIQIIANSLKLTANIIKPIKCKKLDIYCQIGLFNSAQTGIALGGLWTTIGFLLSQLSHWITIQPDVPNVKIVPDFYNSKFDFKYDCIIVFPLGHIIIVMVQAVRFLRVNAILIKGISAYTSNSVS